MDRTFKMSHHIRAQTEERVSILRIDRREKLNALTVEMYAALTDSLRAAESDADVRVHLLLGTDECFTSGNDLNDFLDNPPTDESSPVLQFLTTISSLRKPLIAGVTGPAIGIGTTLLLHCDIVVAATSARFQMPFTRLGLCPEAGASVLLPLSAGYRLAAEMLLTGDPFDGPTAQRAGLVNEIVADADVHSMATKRALQVAALPPQSVQLTKHLLKKANASVVRDAIVLESQQFMERLTSPEAREALTAFREKRKPDFGSF